MSKVNAGTQKRRERRKAGMTARSIYISSYFAQRILLTPKPLCRNRRGGESP